jgi:rsbT co-antagonist protein RsbR
MSEETQEMTHAKALAAALATQREQLLADWIDNQMSAPGMRRDLLSRQDLEQQSRQFLDAFSTAVQRDGDAAVDDEAVRRVLDELSLTRARQGFNTSETATFVFSLKQPVFSRLRQQLGSNPEVLVAASWEASQLLDRLGLYTTEVFQRGREEVILRQQEEMLELSTPVITVWDGILALPVIGTLDSARTQVVMENLLQRIVATGSGIAIIDITGVPTVDTVTAQHLLKTVAAARLMGADSIISGIRPQIAQTIVHLGVDLGGVQTKATLADAFALALRRLNLSVQKAQRGNRPVPADVDAQSKQAD